MYIFILLSLMCLAAALFFAESVLLFTFFLAAFFLVLWTRAFSKKVLLKTFRKKRPITQTSYFRLLPVIKEELKDLGYKDIEVYVFKDKKDIQFYFIDTKPLAIAVSDLLLEVHNEKELRSLLKAAVLIHKSHNFKNRQRLVAFFLYLGGFFRNIDAILCFVFGVNTNQGEPKLIVRWLTSPILNWFCQTLVPGAKKSPELKKLRAVHLIKSQSYLDTKHLNPLFSPLSLTDYILYQD